MTRSAGTDVVPENKKELESGDKLDTIDQVIEGLAGLEKGSRVYLYRIHPEDPNLPTKDKRYVARYEGPIDIEDIKAEHGGGIYRAQCAIFGSDGKKLKGGAGYKAFTFAIDGKPIMKAPAQNNGHQDNNDVVAKLDELKNIILISAMKGSGGDSKSRVETLEEMKLMAEILKSGNGTNGLIDVFTKGVELAQGLAGGENWSGVAREIVPEVLKAFNSRNPEKVFLRKKEKRPAAAPGGQDNTTIDKPKDEDMGNAPADEMADLVKDAIEKGDKPETVARMLNRFISEDEYERIVGISPENLDLFCKTYLPDVEGARDFVDKIISTLKEED